MISRLGDQLRVAVLSAGAWSAATHMPTLRESPGVELLAVTSPNAQMATRMRDEFGFAYAFEDFSDALALEPDVVIVNSPPAFHRDMVVAALEIGADVLCEKPFATTLEDAQAMCAVARRTGRNLLSGFGWIHMPMFSEAGRLVETGEVGEVEFVSIGLSVNVRELLVGGKAYTQSRSDYAPDAATYTDPTISGGGAAAVSMTHAFAVLLALVPHRVTTVFARIFNADSGLDLHDVVVMRLANDAVATVTCTSVHDSNEPVRWRVELCGSEGSIWIDSAEERWLHMRRDGSSAAPDLDRGFSQYQAGSPTLSLLESRRSGIPHPHNNVDLAEQTTELMVATYSSAGNRLEVDLRVRR